MEATAVKLVIEYFTIHSVNSRLGSVLEGMCVLYIRAMPRRNE